MKTLWEIDEALQVMLHEATDRETGEIDIEKLHDIEALEFDKEKKLLAIASVIKGERMEGQAVKQQAEALKARADGHERRAVSLENYVKRHLPEGETVRDDRHWLKWRKSSAVIVEDMAQLPVGMVVQPPRPDPRPDKAAIKKALKDGDVPGAHLEHRMSLRVE